MDDIDFGDQHQWPEEKPPIFREWKSRSTGDKIATIALFVLIVILSLMVWKLTT